MFVVAGGDRFVRTATRTGTGYSRFPTRDHGAQS